MDDRKVILLMDGDTLAFRAAAAIQHTVTTPTGMVEPMARTWEGEAVLDNMIDRLKKRLKADELIIFLSCPSAENFRLKIEPTYKSNRKASVRPMLLDHLKDYLRLNYGATHMAFIEADDAIGIMATSPKWTDQERVIVVGRDKDFKTIPGEHYQLLDDGDDGAPNIRSISPMEAAKAHYVQALSGDAIDGFPGCPGMGKVRAERVVENPIKLSPKEGITPRGKNKGEKVIKWHEGEPCSIWEAIVCNYEKAGLTEADALKTARMARILLWGEYDLETHAVTLWVPGDE
ncbi:hypothetical protein [Mesorhizobium sp. M0767]|uniref:hypothetical protein n=1 Tax=Mesorhizobium sp. M0767 TaxID=2956995 RepID=UPI003334FFA7